MIALNLLIIGNLLTCISISETIASSCDIVPDGIRKPKNINDIDRYIIVINGNPKTYTPNQKYNVSLQVNPNSQTQKAFRRFMLTLESDRDSSTTNLYHSRGQFDFEYGSAVLAKFSEECRDTVMENSKLPKTEIQLYWIAPPENSGCISIKATVVESRDNWFSEDGQLTKKLCEDNADEDFLPPILETCCSCDEAKYEVAFEGKWTRNTHPKDYPSDVWSTKFSDIIGISHQGGHTFWEEGNFASEGLKELAENGITDTLESELKGMGDYIRTIIKARGLSYPNLTQSSYAVFRVDNKNHLVSLVSKLIPSPDWIVGVSNFELCQKDCTWAESYTYNLYPVDAGTNDGIDYLSSRPRYRQKEIAAITPNNPNDPRSPFYSEDGEPMNPFVKLHFTRQRIYEKPCDISSSEFSTNENTLSSGDDNNCLVEEWSEWSSCSASCGSGSRTRNRKLRRPENEKICGNVVLEESQECIEKEKCETDIESNCQNRKWGPWGTCNVTCGAGYKVRLTLPQVQDDDYDNNEGENVCPNQEISECYVPCTESFGESLIMEQSPDGIVKNCRVSPWSTWSECDLNGSSCGRGFMKRSRQILRHPQNGGRKCPSKLFQEKACSVPCQAESSNEKYRTLNFDNTPQCIMSEWSQWTPCSSICGTSAIQQRSRKIIHKPKEVASCPPRLDYKPCNLPIACTDDGRPIYY